MCCVLWPNSENVYYLSLFYQLTLDKHVVYVYLAERGGGGHFGEERRNPSPEGLPERSSAGEGDTETEARPAGESEAEGAERQGEGAQQEGEDLKPKCRGPHGCPSE